MAENYSVGDGGERQLFKQLYIDKSLAAENAASEKCLIAVIACPLIYSRRARVEKSVVCPGAVGKAGTDGGLEYAVARNNPAVLQHRHIFGMHCCRKQLNRTVDGQFRVAVQREKI